MNEIARKREKIETREREKERERGRERERATLGEIKEQKQKVPEPTR